MGLQSRLALYQGLEGIRDRPLIVYVTSTRRGAEGGIAADTVPELLLQLDNLPADTKKLDLLLVSNGGDPTVAWRVVSLIRERVDKFTVLVPQAAFSAATLIALGADEIVMHAHGNLGPTDPQIQAPKPQKTSPEERVAFGSEDLSAFLRFARENVGLSDQTQLLSVFNHFCEEVGSVAVGVAARSSQLSVTMGEKLLQLHMKGDVHRQKARAISEKLTRDFFHHGYPVSRTEAKAIGLPIAEPNAEIERIIWAIWLDLSDELQLRVPFNAIRLLKADPACAALFGPIPQVQIPANIPPQLAQQVMQAALQQMGIAQVPPTTYETTHAVMESRRVVSRFVATGLVYGWRQGDQQIRVLKVPEREAWETVPMHAPAQIRRAKARKKR